MPANLPPQYYEEEKRLRSARTPEEEAEILETLLRLIPKHKGTEKLQADLKRRLSKARGKQRKRSGGSRKGDEHHVEKEGAEALKRAFDTSFDVVNIAARNGAGTDAFLAAAFQVLDKVRVYTKKPGRKPDLENPFVFRKGTTVIEMAREIHKDFEKSYRTARIYSEDKYDGQRVGKDFALRDGDVIELIV